MHFLGRTLWAAALLAAGAIASGAAELLRDPGFQRGFHLLEPPQGRRVVYGEAAGSAPGGAVWDLAQWSSRFPVRAPEGKPAGGILRLANEAKEARVDADGTLSLAVRASREYVRPRRSGAEPWVHLLVQQDFPDPPALGSLAALRFHAEARLVASKLAVTNDYSPGVHAAQYFIYFTVANRSPAAAGFGECFWFGIPVYDNRERMVADYEARDFGETRLFICTPGTAEFAPASTHDGQWVAFDRDLLPLMRRGIEHAHAKGFFHGSADPMDFRPLGIFIGWEVPGMFDVELELRKLSVEATPKKPAG